MNYVFNDVDTLTTGVKQSWYESETFNEQIS